jgi:hypothetical protein
LYNPNRIEHAFLFPSMHASCFAHPVFIIFMFLRIFSGNMTYIEHLNQYYSFRLIFPPRPTYVLLYIERDLWEIIHTVGSLLFSSMSSGCISHSYERNTTKCACVCVCVCGEGGGEFPKMSAVKLNSFHWSAWGAEIGRKVVCDSAVGSEHSDRSSKRL